MAPNRIPRGDDRRHEGARHAVARNGDGGGDDGGDGR